MSDHTMRAEPPTAAEVRAVAALDGSHRPQVLCRHYDHGTSWCAVAWVEVDESGTLRGWDDADWAALDGARSYLMLGPDGPLSWARVAELVAAMAAPIVTRSADYDGGAVCTRCNGARVVDGDACVCAGGGR